MAARAQIKMNMNLATSALNSNVTQSVVLNTVNNTQSGYSNNLIETVSGNLSASAAGVVNSGAMVNTFNTISSRFGYYSPFYAQLITVDIYSRYYLNVPIHKYLAPYGQYYLQDPRVAQSILDQVLPAYRYFANNKPGYLPYQSDRPASVHIDVGVTKPVSLQVDPAYQAYWLYNTRFVRTFSLTY
ncbi:hypothetical protein AB669_05770 [Pedobacter sp. BMA]|nr:hypothetical protein AB669_05770 [Pedobacter sp. BMA]